MSCSSPGRASRAPPSSTFRRLLLRFLPTIHFGLISFFFFLSVKPENSSDFPVKHDAQRLRPYFMHDGDNVARLLCLCHRGLCFRGYTVRAYRRF